VEALEKYLADERARATQVPQLTSQVDHLKALVATIKKDARFRQGAGGILCATDCCA
jgi:hypothetical protein